MDPQLTQLISTNSYYIIFLVLYSLLTIGSVRSLTDGKSRRPVIMHRCPHLLFIQAIANSLIVALILIEVFFSKIKMPIPCAADLWILSVAVPLWFLSRAGATLHLVAMQRASLVTLEHEMEDYLQVEGDDLEQDQIDHEAFDVFMGDLGASREKVSRRDLEDAKEEKKKPGALDWMQEEKGGMDSRRPSTAGDGMIIATVHEGSKTGFMSSSWFLVHRTWFTEKTIVLVAFILIALQMGLSLIMQIVLPSEQMSASADGWQCLVGGGFLVALIPSVIGLLVLIGLLVYQLAYVKEQFGIRLESILILGLVSAFSLVFILISVVPVKDDVRVLVLAILALVFLPSTHIVNVAIPAWQLRNDSPREPNMSKQGLVELLAKPAGMHEFKKFAADEFSVENVLFYQRCLALPTSTSPQQYQARLRKIYELHCLTSSPYPLNLVHSTLKKIRMDFEKAGESGTVDEKVFDQAMSEVLVLMFKDTYPRFLQQKRKKRDSRVGRWDQFAQGV